MRPTSCSVLAISFGLAIVSYVYFESPIRRLGVALAERYGSRRGTAISILRKDGNNAIVRVSPSDRRVADVTH